MNRYGLRWVEDGPTRAATLLRLLLVVAMEFMLEKGHNAWQGATVIQMDCGLQYVIAPYVIAL